MKIRSFALAALIIPILILVSGCGVRKKSLLLKLSKGMAQSEVKSKIGKPDEILSSTTDLLGNTTDIWEYNLATVDVNKENRHITLQLCGWLLFWPLLCFPMTWESPYDYDSYLLKFVNNFLTKWGRATDMRN